MKKAVDLINERAGLGIQLGLEHIDRLMKELGSPHLSQKYIHVGGTNGKGSVSAFISAALMEAGYKVGRFSSPKLFALNDMYSVNGEEIADDRLEELAGRVAVVSAGLEEEGIKSTEFELQTAMAFLYFFEEGCDYSLIEVGLGGTEDATNIIRPVISVITSISFDHSNMLGNSLVEIAEKKAGIIKEGVPVCVSNQEAEVEALIKARADDLGSPYYSLNPDDIEPVRYGLDKTVFRYLGQNYELTQLGSYQVQNAALALLVLDVLKKEAGLNLPDEMVKKGLSKTYWKSRFEVLQTKPLIVLDGAHNEDGIRELKRSLELYFKGRRLRAIFAVMKDKAVESMLRDIAPLFETFLLPDIKKDRALSHKEIAHLLRKLGYQGEIICYSDLNELAGELQTEGGDTVLIAFGSLYYLEEFRMTLYSSEIL